jgi:predicted TIM-barrel fold metal-dependent hydrolase
MIVDAHVHIFPPEIISRRSVIAADEPAFGWLYGDVSARMVSLAELIQVMDQDGIDKSVVCGFPWKDTGRARMHNEYIQDAAGQDPGRLVPLAAVDPMSEGSSSEAERAFSEGAAGLGEIGVYQYDLGDPEVLKRLLPLAELCAEADRPMLLHTNEPVGHDYPGKSPMTLRGLYALIQACPHTRFQLAHLGGGIFFYELLKKEVALTLSRCVFDTAAGPFLYRPALYQYFTGLAGDNRLLFGSDYPLLPLARYRKDLEAAALDEQTTDRILGQNAHHFWNL